MNEKHFSQIKHLPDEIVKIVIERIYKKYNEKVVYVGKGKVDNLFTKRTLCYMVSGRVYNLEIERNHFCGNGCSSHYFVKEEKQLEIKKILI